MVVVVLVAVVLVAVAVKATAATLLSVFKWFETDRLIAKREDVTTSIGTQLVEVRLRQWESASTAGLNRSS